MSRLTMYEANLKDCQKGLDWKDMLKAVMHSTGVLGRCVGSRVHQHLGFSVQVVFAAPLLHSLRAHNTVPAACSPLQGDMPDAIRHQPPR